MSLSRDELLDLLVEECAEVIKAALKAKRFGWMRKAPGFTRNDLALAEEVGDVLGVVDALSLDQALIQQRRGCKIARAEEAKEKAKLGGPA